MEKLQEEEVFIFHTSNPEIKKEVEQGLIPAGIYTSQDVWCGDRWVTHYWFEGKEEVEEGFYLEGEKIGPNTQVYLY